MISVQEAKQLILDHTVVHDAISLPLHEAAGHILASDLFAPHNIPDFPQSSMDGYAFGWIPGEGPYTLLGEMAAGSNEQIVLKKGEAVRIFTGAAVPEGADTVLMQEKARVEGTRIFCEAPNLSAGDNVRPVGSEIGKGALALPKGSEITPAAIGFVAGMGLAEMEVIPSPRITMVVTGNELLTPGEQPAYGKVFEANSYALSAALKAMHMPPQEIFQCGDDVDRLTYYLGQALEKSDVVLMTGGVSVGDYDFTLQAADQCGIQPVFHKIKQKPGKPMYFGVKGKKLFFGLPGNPASVLTCFYQYVLPALEKLSQQKRTLKTVEATLEGQYKKAAGLTHFLKGLYQSNKVQLLSGQESYKLNSFALSNCLIEIPSDTTMVGTGDVVKIHLI